MVGALSDSAVRENAFEATASPPQLERRQRQPAQRQSPAPRRSLPHLALLHAITGARFGREIAAARASQQHHSEEGDEEATESERYATLLASLPESVMMGLRGGEDAGDGGTGGGSTTTTAVDAAAAQSDHGASASPADQPAVGAGPPAAGGPHANTMGQAPRLLESALLLGCT